MQGVPPSGRSSSPNTGQDSAPIVEWAVSAAEKVPRPIPSSAVIGFRNTPNENTLIGPAPTIRASTVATTTHQRFAKMPRIGRFLPLSLPAVCCRPLPGATC